jgi:hypothetical protein
MKVTRKENEDGILTVSIERDQEPTNDIHINTKGEMYNQDGEDLSIEDIERTLPADVTEFIRKNVELQDARCQALRDAVIADLKAALAQGDETTLDEILTFVPHKNLVQALPEEKWKGFQLCYFTQPQD